MEYELWISFHKDTIEKLKSLGYRVESNQDKYMTWFNDEFVSGAGVKLPREKPLHWKHAQQNRKDFYMNGWDEAIKDARKRKLIK